MTRPRIAVMLDEDTSRGGSNYALSKNYFSAIDRAGGLPFGIPYIPDMVPIVVHEFDGFFSVGGGIALPDDWRATDATSLYPQSERLPIEIDIMKGFLDRNKPVFGSCHGMQVLAGISGCKLQSARNPEGHQTSHSVTLSRHSQLFKIVGQAEMTVNSRHREVIGQISDAVRVGATAPDGTIEGIEVIGQSFAIGCQWHQEDFWKDAHPGNRIMDAFILAASKRRNSCG